MALDWRIYYADGSTFDNLDGTPADAPGRGVQAILMRDTTDPSSPDHVGRFVVAESDYYWWNEDEAEWIGGDLAGLLDHLGEPGVKIVKRGLCLTRLAYKQAIGRAVADPDFPPKSAFGTHEPRP